jgi:hypothetical protein
VTGNQNLIIKGSNQCDAKWTEGNAIVDKKKIVDIATFFALLNRWATSLTINGICHVFSGYMELRSDIFVSWRFDKELDEGPRLPRR